MDVPLNKRGTIRSLASQIGVPKTTVHRYFKKGKGKVHTSTVKPFLVLVWIVLGLLVLVMVVLIQPLLVQGAN